MTGHVHAHRNDGEEVMPAAFLDRILNGESAVTVGDGPDGVSAAGARRPTFLDAEIRMPSCVQAVAACFLLFSPVFNRLRKHCRHGQSHRGPGSG